MKKFINPIIAFIAIGCFILPCNSSMFDADSCYSFGSGNVFPGGARKVDHKLQVTKAVSKYLNRAYIKIKVDSK